MRPKTNRGLPTPPREPDLHSQSTLAVPKGGGPFPFSSIDSSVSETSRSLYKAMSRHSPKLLRESEYDWRLQDLELRELKLQLREKQNELLELKTKHENELESVKKLAILQAKSQEVSLKEQLQETTEETQAELWTLKEKATALEQAVADSASPKTCQQVQELELAMSSVEQEVGQAMQENAWLKSAEHHYCNLADRAFKSVAQLQHTLRTLFSVPDLPQPLPQGDPAKSLARTLDLLKELKTEANANLFQYLAYYKDSN